MMAKSSRIGTGRMKSNEREQRIVVLWNEYVEVAMKTCVS